MSTPTESATRARTRRAILDAAIGVFAQQSSASLSDVADAAGVGRSTLHRYFPDRAALVQALLDDAVTATQQAVDDAALDRGTAADALRRLVHTHYELGPRMNFLFNEVPDDEWDNDAFERAQWPVGELIARGQADGTLDANVSTDWIIRVLWYLLMAGWEAVADGAMAKHEALDNVVRTLEHGISSPPRTERSRNLA